MRLLIADDENLVRDALTVFLRSMQRDMQIVGAAALDEAMARAGELPDLDVVLINLSMPGMNGGDGVRRMIAAAPRAKIVILSGRIGREEAQRAIRDGAAGVISKQLPGAALIDALRLILNGEKYVSSSLQDQHEVARVEISREIAGKPHDLVNLSDKERATLAALATGLSNKEIGRELGVAEITVKVRLQSIFRKIGARNRTEAARIALATASG